MLMCKRPEDITMCKQSGVTHGVLDQIYTAMSTVAEQVARLTGGHADVAVARYLLAAPLG